MKKIDECWQATIKALLKKGLTIKDTAIPNIAYHAYQIGYEDAKRDDG